MAFASVYPHYIAKAEQKGRTKDEVHAIIHWLTGYDEPTLQQQIVPIMFDQEIHVHYGQFYVESRTDDFFEALTESRGGQANGLCGAAVPGLLVPDGRRRVVDEADCPESHGLEDGILIGKRYLIHDRDPLFIAEFLGLSR